MVPELLFAATLSAPSIELYTMGPGDHLFERFGHAAICVSDSASRERAVCYNYGTADFGSPPERLGWEFLRGTSRFWVSVTTPARLIETYRRADRSIYRQRLPLTGEQARAVAARLAHDAKPENREYVYHHFTDNCSTRIRDVLDKATAGALSSTSERSGPSYRALARDALAGVPVALVAGDLFVGRRADAPTSTREAMFLPEHLRTAVRERLGAEPVVVHQRRQVTAPGRAGTTWPYFALAAAFAGLFAAFARRARSARPWLVPPAVLLGTLALAIWFVALSTAVPELSRNEALAVFWPTDALLPVLSDAWRARYARLRLLGVLVVSVLLALGVFLQPLFAAVLVVAVPMAVLAGGGPEHRTGPSGWGMPSETPSGRVDQKPTSTVP